MKRHNFTRAFRKKGIGHVSAAQSASLSEHGGAVRRCSEQRGSDKQSDVNVVTNIKNDWTPRLRRLGHVFVGALSELHRRAMQGGEERATVRARGGW